MLKKGRQPEFVGSLRVAAWLNDGADKTTFVGVLGSRAILHPIEEDQSGEEVVEDFFD